MDRLVYPLEQDSYSWFAANLSTNDNDSSLSFSTSDSMQNHWLIQAEVLNRFFKVQPQHISIGFLSMIIMQGGFKGFEVQYQQRYFLAGKRILDIADLVIRNVLKTLLGTLLLLVMVPLILPFVCLFWLVSAVVKIAYACQYGQKVSKVEGMDGVWGLETKESRPFIIVSLLLSGKPDLVKIRKNITTKILDVRDHTGDYKFKKFRQTFLKRYGYYMWKDVEDFDISDHVRVIDMSELCENKSSSVGECFHKARPEEDQNNGKSSSSQMVDDQLYGFLSEESTVALSGDRPPWEVLLLVRGDGSYNVVIRLHHAIGDGVTMMRVFLESLADKPLAPPRVGSCLNNPLIKALMMVWSILVLPFGMLQIAANFDYNSLHGGVLSGKKIIASSRGIPLQVLKKVKVASRSTVNDVLMSSLSAALSKHFSRRLEKIDQITAVIPVSFHDLQAPVSLTNQFSVATVKLPVLHSLTASKRLKAMKNLMDKMKRDPTLLAVFSVVRAVSHVLPAPVAELLLSGRGVTVAASNVPGPQQEVTIWGDRVQGIQFWVPNRAPVGVGFSFASYMGVIKVGLNIDDALVHSREEAQQMLDDIEQEIYKMYNSVEAPHEIPLNV